MPTPVPGQLPPGLLMLSQYMQNNPEAEDQASRLVGNDKGLIDAANAQETGDVQTVFGNEKALQAKENTAASSTPGYLQMPATGTSPDGSPSYAGYAGDGGSSQKYPGWTIDPTTGHATGTGIDPTTGKLTNSNPITGATSVAATSTPAVNNPYDPNIPLDAADQKIADTDQANLQSAYSQFGQLQAGDAAAQLNQGAGANYTQGDQNLDNALFQGSTAGANLPGESYDPNSFNEGLQGAAKTATEVTNSKKPGEGGLNTIPASSPDAGTLPPALPNGHNPGTTPETVPAYKTLGTNGPEYGINGFLNNPNGKYSPRGFPPAGTPIYPGGPIYSPPGVNDGPGSPDGPTGPVTVGPTTQPTQPTPTVPTSSTDTSGGIGQSKKFPTRDGGDNMTSSTTTGATGGSGGSLSSPQPVQSDNDPTGNNTGKDLVVGNVSAAPGASQTPTAGASDYGSVADVVSDEEDNRRRAGQQPAYMAWS